MVKVKIEYKGKVKEFEEDAVIALFPRNENAHAVITGKTNIKKIVKALSACIPDILELVSDDRLEYIASMIEVNDSIDKKIKEELKAGGVHPLVDKLIKEINEDE